MADDPHIFDETIAVFHVYVDVIDGQTLRRRIPVKQIAPGAEIAAAEVMLDLSEELEGSADADEVDLSDLTEWAGLAFTVGDA